MVIRCIAGPLYQQLRREDDSSVQKIRKLVLPSILIIQSAVIFLSMLPWFAGIAASDWALEVPSLIMMSFNAVWMAFVLRKKAISDVAVGSLLLLCTILTFWVDLYNASVVESRWWPLMVPIIDLALLCKIPPAWIQGTVVGAVLWLVFMGSESSWRYGVYDAPWVDKERTNVCNCGDPPCPLGGQQISSTLFSILVFVTDFLMTRRFADAMQKEKMKVEAAVSAAERVSSALANFDLDSAEDSLQEEAKLPPDLYLSLSSILENLKRYKPFLPQVLFDTATTELTSPRSTEHITAPGVTCGRAALVFTDIQGSTELWEAEPEGMKKGLRNHNNVIRHCLREYGGYEVKTIGDAFMAAFETATAACRFGLAVQEELYHSRWPEALLVLQQCCRVEGLWCGIRVRIGVHVGDVSVELNEVVGRYDYYGQTVNKAARVEGRCVGGVVAVTAEVLEDIKNDGLPAHVIDIGCWYLKGIVQKTELWLLVPSSLPGRSAYALDQLSAIDLNSPKSPVAAFSPTTLLPLQEERSATTARVEVPCAFGEEDTAAQVFRRLLPRILSSLEQSDGAVIAVAGATAVLGWNIDRKTPFHGLGALRFISLLHRRKVRDLRVGAAISKAFYGRMGDANQKFLNVAAPSITLGKLLVRAAEELNTFALYSAVGDVVQPSAGLRPIDVHVTSIGVVHTFEVSSRPVSTLHPSDFAESEVLEEFSWGWSSGYCAAFKTKDVKTMRASAPHDHVVMLVASAIEQVSHIVKLPCVE